MNHYEFLYLLILYSQKNFTIKWTACVELVRCLKIFFIFLKQIIQDFGLNKELNLLKGKIKKVLISVKAIKKFKLNQMTQKFFLTIDLYYPWFCFKNKLCFSYCISYLILFTSIIYFSIRSNLNKANKLFTGIIFNYILTGLVKYLSDSW